MTDTPRRFFLNRTVDDTGVSGIGDVAEGVQFADGHVALRWHGEHRSTVTWESIDDAIAVHGHDGKTTVRWVDDENGDFVDEIQLRSELAARAAGYLHEEGSTAGPLQYREVVALAEYLRTGEWPGQVRAVKGSVTFGNATSTAPTF